MFEGIKLSSSLSDLRENSLIVVLLIKTSPSLDISILTLFSGKLLIVFLSMLGKSIDIVFKSIN